MKNWEALKAVHEGKIVYTSEGMYRRVVNGIYQGKGKGGLWSEMEPKPWAVLFISPTLNWEVEALCDISQVAEQFWPFYEVLAWETTGGYWVSSVNGRLQPNLPLEAIEVAGPSKKEADSRLLAMLTAILHCGV